MTPTEHLAQIRERHQRMGFPPTYLVLLSDFDWLMEMVGRMNRFVAAYHRYYGPAGGNMKTFQELQDAMNAIENGDMK